MRGVHVDHDQPVTVLGEDINAAELCDREAQGRHLAGLRTGLRHGRSGAERGVACQCLPDTGDASAASGLR